MGGIIPMFSAAPFNLGLQWLPEYPMFLTWVFIYFYIVRALSIPDRFLTNAMNSITWLKRLNSVNTSFSANVAITITQFSAFRVILSVRIRATFAVYFLR